MTAVSVGYNGTLAHDMGDTDGTTNIGSIGGGAGAGSEPDFVYQGSNSISRKVGTSEAGFDLTAISQARIFAPLNTNNTRANAWEEGVWMAKVIATNKSVLLERGAPALRVRLGSSSANYRFFDIHGASSYPLKGGWVIFPIEDIAFYAEGTADFGAGNRIVGSNYFAVTADFSTTSKSENLAMDAIHVGLGLTLVGGDGADADGTLDNFVAADQGTVANRYGYFVLEGGIYTVFGRHWIGQNPIQLASATVFQESGKIISIPYGLYRRKGCGFAHDLSNASTDIDWTGCQFICQGRSGWAEFDTENDIDAIADEITNQDVIDLLSPGDPIVFYPAGGTETPGVTGAAQTLYYAGKDETATPTGITIHASRTEALGWSSGATTPTPIALTASSAGNGERWYVQIKEQSEAAIIAEGTSGALDFTSCSFTKLRDFELTSAVTIQSCSLLEPTFINQNGATIDDCSFSDQKTVPGQALIECDDPDLITNSEFVAGAAGHALRITAAGTYDLDDLIFTGYDPGTYEQEFDSNSDVDAISDVITITGHPYATGDAVFYSDETNDLPRTLQNDYYTSSGATGTTFDLSVTILSSTTCIILGMTGDDGTSRTVNSVQIDPGGGNQASFTALQNNTNSVDLWWTGYLASGSIPPAGTYTIRITLSGTGMDVAFAVEQIGDTDLTTPIARSASYSTTNNQWREEWAEQAGNILRRSFLHNSNSSTTTPAPDEIAVNIDRFAATQLATKSPGTPQNAYVAVGIIGQETTRPAGRRWSIRSSIAGAIPGVLVAVDIQGVTAQSIGLTNNQMYYVRNVSANTIALYLNKGDAINDNARIALTASGSSQTHKFYGANAAIWNDSGGAVTLNVLGGTSPSIRNTAGSTTTVNNSVTVTVTGVTEGAAIVVQAKESAGTVTNGDVLGSGFADSTGTFSFSLNFEAAFGAGLDVEVRARDSGIIRSLLSYDDSAGTYTDYTDEAHSAVGSGDVPILQTDGDLFDHMYFASHEPFYGIKFDVVTAWVGSYAPTVYFWDGLAWSAISAVNYIQNDSLEDLGPRYLRWTEASTSGWAQHSINGVGPYYWIRFQRSGFSSLTTRAVCRKLSIDKTKYLPFTQRNTITSSGLTVTASWIEDDIVSFGG